MFPYDGVVEGVFPAPPVPPPDPPIPPPPPDPPSLPGVTFGLGLLVPPPPPPPADIIVEKTEFDPLAPLCNGTPGPVPAVPPAPTVIGIAPTDAHKAVPPKGEGPAA